MGSSASTDLPLGTVIRETYEIAGVLGRGGMGTVFLANHLRLPGRQVAIKVLRNDGGLGKDVYVRFRREAEIASRLGHPNIVEVLDFDSLEDGAPFLVMECLRGQPLSRRLRKGPLTLEEVFSIARQMGSALQAAHRAGIVHRDLKPGNVFLVRTEVGGVAMEHVKLLDFGISKVIDSQSVNTAGGILLGTPQYMAPEQAQGKNQEVDPRTDIFSFGCMVYEMLGRRLPFKDGPLPELIYRIVYDPPTPLESLVSGVPEQVVEAIGRALEKRPEDRHPDVGAFIEALTGSPLQTVSPDLTPSSPVLAVRPSQLETVTPKRPPPEEKPASQQPTVAGRAARASANPEPSAKRPVVNVPLHEVSTMTVGAPVPEGTPAESARPEVLLRAEDAPAPGNPTQMLRPKVGVANGAPSFLAMARTRKRWWAVAAVLVFVAGGATVFALRPGAMGGQPVTPAAKGKGTEPGQQGAGASGPVVAPPEQQEAAVAPSGTAPSTPTESGAAPSPPEQPGTAVARNGAPPSQPPQPGTVVAQSPGAPAESPSASQPEAPAARSPGASSTTVATPKGSTGPAPSKGTSGTIAQAALDDLVAAEKALARGDTDEALHLTRRSQRVQVTGTSFSLLTRTHCRQKDLANALTAWERVPRWERTKVRDYCKQYDIEL